jgi:non-homologous end joining protein Ku
MGRSREGLRGRTRLFIAVTEDDFKTAAVERSHSIDIRDFVPVDDIDPRYWDTRI